MWLRKVKSNPSIHCPLFEDPIHSKDVAESVYICGSDQRLTQMFTVSLDIFRRRKKPVNLATTCNQF